MTGATLSAGAGDVAGISAPRELRALVSGDRVGPLEVLETPGHTPGSISLFEQGTGVLVAGDALTADGSGLTAPSGQHTADMTTALLSLGVIADRTPTTVLVGHGPAVTNEAGLTSALRALAG